MNYKVTFYKDEMEMLTERKANFVNNVKKLTSQVMSKLARECGGNGETSGMAIFNHLKQMHYDREKVWRCGITLDNYKNFKLDNFTNTGKPIPFNFKFVTGGDNESYSRFDARGHVLPKTIMGRKFISEVYIELDFSLCLTDNPKIVVKQLINEIQSTLTHELAHAHDEFMMGELSQYKEKGVSDEDLRYILYWTKPTEIRSHMLEVIQNLNSKKHHSFERTFKNMYKTHQTAEEAGIQHSPKDKENMKTAYSMLKKHNSSIIIDKKSSDALDDVIDRAFHNQCPPLHKKFIHDYHIAFIQQSNPKMKERFYDKLFPNTPTQPLDKLNDFLEGMKSVARALTKLDNEISKHVTMCWRSSSWKRVEMIENAEKTKAAYKEFRNKIWENDSPMKQAFKDYDVKILKNAAKQMIEEFREQHGLMTKAMLKKAAAKDFGK
ncbi:MAG: hypothetical protein J6R59_00510 [Paludibacteraceae bacterium]|nr:hypothetical protein [Paludibacteraceae bacterium]